MNLRQAAQQALEALENPDGLDEYNRSISDNAITALRAALAEPEQEPVAWAFRYSDGTYHDPSVTKHSRGILPLYSCAATPQRKPLTDEEISELLTLHHGWLELARAVERAHGIGEQA